MRNSLGANPNLGVILAKELIERAMKYRIITPTVLAIVATLTPKALISAASAPDAASDAAVAAAHAAAQGFPQIMPLLDKGITIGVLLMFSFWFQNRLAEKDAALLKLTQEVSASNEKLTTNNGKVADALGAAIEILNRLTSKQRHHE